MAVQKGFTLIEQLICVVIVAILATISIVSYQGALDQGDLKYAAPGIVGRLEALRREAAEKSITITVDFQIGTPRWKITRRKGTEESSVEQDLAEESLIKRRLVFLRYEWPDGTKTPERFTFLAGTKAEGGTLYFGTGRAETTIKVAGGRVDCPLGIRAPR